MGNTDGDMLVVGGKTINHVGNNGLLRYRCVNVDKEAEDELCLLTIFTDKLVVRNHLPKFIVSDTKIERLEKGETRRGREGSLR